MLAVMEKCSLYRDDPALRQSGTYVIKADVSPDVFTAFVSKATNEGADVKVTEDNIDALKALCEELGFHGFDAEFQAFGLKTQDAALKRDVCLLMEDMQEYKVVVEGIKHEIGNFRAQLDGLRGQLLEEVNESARHMREEFRALFEGLRQEVRDLREELGWVRQSSDEQRGKAHDEMQELETRVGAQIDTRVRDLERSIMSRQEAATVARPAPPIAPVPAVLGNVPVRQDYLIGWLRDREAQLHQKQVVVRLSSRDPYGWLNPDSSDEYCSFDTPGAWIEIEFKEAVFVRGVRVTSGECEFPKTFDVKLSDGPGCRVKETCSFVNERGLNGENLSVEETFRPVWVRFVRIESCGPNWEGNQCLNLGGFELLGQYRSYRDGVFRGIFSWGEDDAWRSFDVRARDIDGSKIHIRDTQANICTFDGDQEWLEVEIVRGSLLVSGYELRKPETRMRVWSLWGSNDRSLDLDEWDLIHRNREQDQTDEVQQFQCSWPTPFRYLRLVNEGPDWDGDKRINLYYFDVSGTFIPD